MTRALSPANVRSMSTIDHRRAQNSGSARKLMADQPRSHLRRATRPLATNTITTPTTAAGTFAVFNSNNKIDDHLIRVGLNYRFGGSGFTR